MMGKYFDKSIVTELAKSVKTVIQIRNEIFLKYNIDILDNDTISSLQFFDTIKTIDEKYNCNFSRNGEDGKTIIENKEIHVEIKTSKTLKGKTSFAFHAKGLIDHKCYIFNVWEKNTLKPLRCYYVINPSKVNMINKKLLEMSKEWERKPTTKAGYDVIRINEIFLEEMIESKKNINNCEVYIL